MTLDEQSTPAEIRIMIVDDHPAVGGHLPGVVSAEPALGVTGIVPFDREAATAVDPQQHGPAYEDLAVDHFHLGITEGQTTADGQNVELQRFSRGEERLEMAIAVTADGTSEDTAHRAAPTPYCLHTNTRPLVTLSLTAHPTRPGSASCQSIPTIPMCCTRPRMSPT